MARYIGQRVEVGIAREASRGVSPNYMDYWLPRTTLTFDDKVKKVEIQESLGQIDAVNEAYTVQRRGEGTIAGYVRDRSIGTLLYATLGAVSSAVKETTAYNHTFTLANTNQHTSLTINVHDPVTTASTNGDTSFSLAMINKMEFEAKQGEMLTFSADFISKGSADTEGQNPVYLSENKFTCKHVQFKVAATTSALTGATAVDIMSFKLTIGKNLMEYQPLGTLHSADIMNQQFMVEGEIELLNEDKTYRNYMIDGTYKSLRIDALNGDVTIGATSNPRLMIDLSRVHFFDWNDTSDLDKVSTQKIKFKGLYNFATSENSISQIVLTNTTTAY